MASGPTNLAAHEQATGFVEATPGLGVIQPAPMAAISFVELAAICHVLEIKLDHSSGLHGWNLLALRNEKRELRSFQKIPTIVTLQITFCMLLACHAGSAMRVPVPNTQLNIERSSEHDRAASFNSVLRCT